MSNTKLLGIGLIAFLLIGLVLKFQNHAPKTSVAPNQTAIRYLPLGDSYTIGESVADADRWPNQLVKRFAQNGKRLEIVANPSVTGYTTQDLIDRELPLVQQLKPDFVTILIGVNDYVQGVSAVTFEQHLDYIISSIQKQIPEPGNIALVTIPDYGKTPSGSQYSSPETSEAGIKAYNTIITQAGNKYNLTVADIFTASQKVVSDPSLIADDGLHPSAKQYTDWTDIIYHALESSKIP